MHPKLDSFFKRCKYIKIGDHVCDLELPLPYVEGVRVRFSGFSAIFDDKLLRTFAETVVGAASADVLLTKAYFRRGIYIYNKAWPYRG